MCLKKHQEEGRWKHPRDGGGVCILSVSKDRSESWKSRELRADTRVLPFCDPHQSEKEREWVTFISPFRVTGSVKSRISCRNVMPDVHARHVSGLNVSQNAFTMGRVHNQWVHTTRSTPVVSYQENVLGIQTQPRSPRPYPPLMPLGWWPTSRLPYERQRLTRPGGHRDSPLSVETRLSEGSPWIRTHLSQSSRLLYPQQSLWNHGYRSHFLGRRGYGFNSMRRTPQTWI